MPTRNLLKHALPLIRTHGFTRHTLSLAALSLPKSDSSSSSTLSHPSHTHSRLEPLSDTAITALFGPGDEACKTLIWAWLDEGIKRMGRLEGEATDSDKTPSQSRTSTFTSPSPSTSLRTALHRRLEYNIPVLEHIPEAFALLSLPSLPLPLRSVLPFPLDPTPAITHATQIAHEACILAGYTDVGTKWYAQRASIALVYTAAELHQLASPHTALNFLDSLLESRDSLRGIGQFVEYVGRSWGGIIRSQGMV